MRFSVLGPLEVADDAGAPVILGTPGQRQTLIALLLLTGPASTQDALIAALWADTPPSGKDPLRTKIWELRREPALRARLETRRKGSYQLRVGHGELDAADFTDRAGHGRSALADGDIHEAARLLQEAAGLWRDPPWLDWPQTPAMHRHMHRLETLRADTMEALQEARLGLGQYRDVTGPLRDIVAADPLREHAWALLIRALHLGGHVAEALAEYGNARSVIVRELGQDPGPELQGLHRQLLTGAPVLGATAQLAAAGAGPVFQLPAAPGDFTGRAAEIGELGRRLAGGDAAVTVLVVTGPAGAGKTALALHCGHQVHESFPGGQLYARLAGADGPRDPQEVLAEMLRALGVAPARVTQTAGHERETLYRSLLAYRKVLVVADGASSAAQVRPLLPGTPGSALLVTSRSRLPGLEAAHLAEVGALPPGEAAALVRRIAGPGKDLPGAAAAFDAIAVACGGLPLALRIAGNRLAAEPALTPGALAAALAAGPRRLVELTSGDLSVSAELGAAYEGLGGLAQRAFRLASLHPGGDIPGWLMPVLTSDPDAAAAADTMVSAGLLTAAPVPGDALPRYRMHPLARTYASWMLGTTSLADRNAATGRLLAGWLDLASYASRQLPRYPYVPVPAEPQRPRLVADGTCAIIVGQAVDWFTREAANLEAVTQEACRRDHALAAGLAAHQLASQLQRRAFGAAAQLWTSVATAAARAQDHRAQARARYHLAVAMLAQNRYDRQAVSVLTGCLQAFSDARDAAWRADTLHLLALCAIDDDDPAAARARAEEALAIARREQNQRLTFLSLSALGIVLAGTGETDAGLACCEEALSIATDLGEPEYVAAASRAAGRARATTPGSWGWRRNATMSADGTRRPASA